MYDKDLRYLSLIYNTESGATISFQIVTMKDNYPYVFAFEGFIPYLP